MNPHWDNPEPGVYEATVQRTQNVILEVYESNAEDNAGHFVWWAYAAGRLIGTGDVIGLEAAKAACLAAAT